MVAQKEPKLILMKKLNNYLKSYTMKNKKSISQFKKFQISTVTITKIIGGEKKVIIRDDEEIE